MVDSHLAELYTKLEAMQDARVVIPGEFGLTQFRSLGRWIVEAVAAAEAENRVRAEFAAARAKPDGYWVEMSERGLLLFRDLHTSHRGYLEAREKAGELEREYDRDGKPTGRIHLNDPVEHKQLRKAAKPKPGRSPKGRKPAE